MSNKVYCPGRRSAKITKPFNQTKVIDKLHKITIENRYQENCCSTTRVSAKVRTTTS